MLVTFDLTQIIACQLDLDRFIHHQHQLELAATFQKRYFALIVELGEFMAEVGTFFYDQVDFQLQKQAALDELVDILHFFASIFLQLHNYRLATNHQLSVIVTNFDVSADRLAINQQLLSLVRNISDLLQVDRILLWLQNLMKIVFGLGFKAEEIYVAHKMKNEINYQRQHNQY